MASIIKCVALSGTELESAPCCLLQVDEFKFLMDCGLPHSRDLTYLNNIKKLSHQLDAVFLSQQDPLHLGGFPLLVNNGLSCPVYATELVKCMGHISCYDLVQSEGESDGNRELYSLDDVDIAFERIKEVRYNQVISLQGKMGTRVVVTAIQAGHMIGGAVWKVVRDGQDAIVYASQINHRKEWHLDSSELPSIKRPHLLIITAPSCLHQASLKTRDDKLLKTCQATVRRGGNVLLCCDTAGRVLELVYLLEQWWRRQDTGLMAYNLVLCSPVAFNVVNFASLRLEWLNQKVMRAFESSRTNPFATRFLQVCHSLHELNSIHGPKVVMTTQPSLETGFAKELFSMWATNPKNTVFFAVKPPPGSLGRRVMEVGSTGGKVGEVDVKVGKKVVLQGAELTDWQEKEKKTEEKWKEEGMSDDEEEEEDDEVVEMIHDMYPGEHGAHLMFPHKEAPLKWDHYGVHVELASLFDSAPTHKSLTSAHPSNHNNPSNNATQPFNTPDVPFKVEMNVAQVEVCCEVVWQDFEGTSDVNSILRILKILCPRHLVFMGHVGNKMSKLFDNNFLPDNTNLHLPIIQQPIDVSSDSQILQLRLKDSLLSDLHFSQLEGSDVQLTYFSSIVSSETQPSEVRVGGGDEDEGVLTLEHLPSTTPAPLHPQVFINRPLLSELKTKILQAGIEADMSGGVLVCGNQIIVKKAESGRYEIEGQVGKLFYQVKQVLSQCFVVV